MNFRKRLEMAAAMGALGWYVINHIPSPKGSGVGIMALQVGVSWIWPTMCVLVALSSPW